MIRLGWAMLLGLDLAGCNCAPLDARTRYRCEPDGSCVQPGYQCRADLWCHPAGDGIDGGGADGGGVDGGDVDGGEVDGGGVDGGEVDGGGVDGGGVDGGGVDDGGTVLVFTPTDDASVYQANPTTNYGAGVDLEVDASPVKDFLLKFTVTNVGTRPVVSAILRLRSVGYSPSGGNIYRTADTGWSEATVTWDTAPPAGGALIGKLGEVSSSTTYDVTTTGLVVGDGVYSLRVSAASTDGADYSAREGGTPPELRITVR